MTFTEELREELGGLPLGSRRAARVEASALARFGGALHLTGAEDAGQRLRLELTTTSGAVARRAYALLSMLYDRRPELQAREPSGVRTRTQYAVVVSGARTCATDLGLLRADRPVAGLPAVVGGRRDVEPFVRGALAATGSVNTPGRAPHLEIGAPSDAVAAEFAARLTDWLGVRAGSPPGRRPRVVVKSGAGIARLLLTAGATQAYLRYEEQRLRREVRSDAVRLANADAANLDRVVAAAQEQARLVRRAVDRAGWDGLDDELREIALVRLANPDATLSELGELCDPPVGKSTVHRRLSRLARLGERP